MIQTISHPQQPDTASAAATRLNVGTKPLSSKPVGAGFIPARPVGAEFISARNNANLSIKKPLLPLRKVETSSFVLNIPSSVESKIRYLCSTFPRNEWSGVLFYSVSGSFESSDLSLTCVDIFPMDVGSATFTDFRDSPDVAAYIAQHDELLQPSVYEGLLHSHDQMATFFSGTDLDTLAQEGECRNHFLSLIVNNAGTYTAALTRLVSTSTSTTGTLSLLTSSSYNSWDNKHITLLSDQKSQKVVNEHSDDKIIEYYPLRIVKEVSVPFSDLDSRLTEIRTSKTNTSFSSNTSVGTGSSSDSSNSSNSSNRSNSANSFPDRPYLSSFHKNDDFFDDYDDYSDFYGDTYNDLNAYSPSTSTKTASKTVSSASSDSSVPDPGIVDNLLCKIISGDILSKESDPFKRCFCIDDYYSATFHCNVSVPSKSDEYTLFESWIDNIIDTVLYLPNDFYSSASARDLNYDHLVSVLASDMYDRLSALNTVSSVVDVILTSLRRYVDQ